MKVIVKDLKNKKIAVAVSGGSDSVALLHFLYINKEILNIKLSAVNIEHGIRGEQSVKDSEFVESLAKSMKVPLIKYSVDAPLYALENKMGIEQAARKIRYECFEKAIKSHSLDYVLTAHHSGDSAETVLFNLFRGSSLSGVKGIAYENGEILRPLIDTKKSEILEYIKNNELSYVDDSTNFDTAYSRNFIRHNILAVAENKFEGATNAINRFSKLAKLDDDYLQNLAENIVKTDENSVKIEFCLDKPIFYRAVIIALSRLGQDSDYTLKTAESVYGLQENSSGATVDITAEIKAVKDYTHITIYKFKQADFKEAMFKTGEILFDGKTVKIENSSGENIGNYFDFEKLPKGCVIRKRKDGDIFTKFGGGTKKLKSYLIDKKIPKRDRDNLLLIANGHEIFAIIGVEISDKIKVDKNSKIIYNITIN